MMVCQLTSLVLTLLLGELVSATDIRGHHIVDAYGKFNISWSASGTEPGDEITFTIEAATTGWVGLGLSSNGGMVNSDIVVAWVNSEGEPYIEDRHARENGFPQLDSSTDISLISAVERDGKTIVTYKRNLQTCDKLDDMAINQADTIRLLYAYGDKDPEGDVFTAADKHEHSYRGSKSVYLLDPIKPTSNLPDDMLTFDVTIDDYQVPAQDTTYYCTFNSAPKLDTKHHIIAMEPLITPGNEGLVHHMVLYGCWNFTMEHLKDSNETSGQCYTAEMPEFVMSCRSLIHAWAVGGSTFYYPEHAGVPLGEEDSPEYFMLEMHYDNPSMVSGHRDSSGLRIMYTPTPRKEDVATFEAGAVIGIVAPPQTQSFRWAAYCHSACTEQWIPKGGINVFGYFLHAHLLGVGLQVDWYRDGNPIGIFAKDRNYDFNFQENRLFPEEKKILPGDELKVTCWYDSSKRDKATYGGLGSREEMCLAFFAYYPKQDISGCESKPTFMYERDHELYSSLGVSASEKKAMFDPTAVDINISLSNVTWSDELSKVTQKNVDTTDQKPSCLKSTGSYYPMKNEVIKAKDYAVFLEEDPDTFCVGSSDNNLDVNPYNGARASSSMFYQAVLVILPTATILSEMY